MKNIFFVSVFVAMAMAGCGTPTLIDFDNLSSVTATNPTLHPVNPGDVFKVGDVLIENTSGVQLRVLPFQWGNSQWTSNGEVRVVQSNQAGGSGNEIHFNNACLGVIAPQAQDIKNVTFKFGYYGGNINLIENGIVHNYGGFAPIPSPTPSGVNVVVTPGGPLGTIQLSGTMAKYYFYFPVPPGFPVLQYTAVLGGGQELWIDDVEFSD